MGEINSGAKPPQRLSDLTTKYGLAPQQVAWLRAAGVRTEADMFSFLVASPDLGAREIFDTPGLTFQLSKTDKVLAMMSGVEKFQREGSIAFGAKAPPNAPFQEGDKVEDFTPSQMSMLANLEPRAPSLDSIQPSYSCGPWAIRDQGQRGTCVSFATIALYEHYLCKTADRAVDLSEQFLYWALKHHNLDPYTNQDGTWFEYIAPVLAAYGTCLESDWKYDPNIRPNVSHNPPPAGAEAAAKPNKTNKTTVQTFSTTSGKAAQLLSALNKNGAVGIAVPVFSHPGSRNNHNWNTYAALSYGAVQNPLPSWSVDGGHAVCVVGFAPDSEEPLGGYFIIRNSWGTSFGSRLPDSSYAGPAPGYGQISASYIDKYLWELCVFG